ncbi:hypothetical protein NDK47_23875 [Brevibacillus ruminantium]|uniref:Uncharacterized protein n=1 Tax=Brevibacillus ruminantium TaxID=2950604 RepID=A0ABY4WH09_9BACL|nr:hypothetical protein [Brevibacillus ruminantium]USG65125.1 hypothetical protein NDK47_23875 [Brevibacillus ruminantium]
MTNRLINDYRAANYVIARLDEENNTYNLQMNFFECDPEGNSYKYFVNEDVTAEEFRFLRDLREPNEIYIEREWD